MSLDLEDIKREVATANRVLANLGLATGVMSCPRTRQHARPRRAQPLFCQRPRI